MVEHVQCPLIDGSPRGVSLNPFPSLIIRLSRLRELRVNGSTSAAVLRRFHTSPARLSGRGRSGSPGVARISVRVTFWYSGSSLRLRLGMVFHRFTFDLMDVDQTHVLGNGHTPIVVSEVEPAFTRIVEHVDVIAPRIHKRRQMFLVIISLFQNVIGNHFSPFQNSPFSHPSWSVMIAFAISQAFASVIFSFSVSTTIQPLPYLDTTYCS